MAGDRENKYKEVFKNAGNRRAGEMENAGGPVGDGRKAVLRSARGS